MLVAFSAVSSLAMSRPLVVVKVFQFSLAAAAPLRLALLIPASTPKAWRAVRHQSPLWWRQWLPPRPLLQPLQRLLPARPWRVWPCLRLPS